MKRSLFLYIFLTFAANLPGISLAASQSKPLMTIRFNSDTVSYEQTLGKAVKMAMAAKPGVMFDLVAISPETADKNSNKEFSDDIKLSAEKVAAQIANAGVTPDMVHTSYQTDKLVKNNEIQIFVQ